MTTRLFPADPALNDLVLVLIAFLYVLVIIGVSMVLKKKGVISSHTARKIVHLFAGISCFIVPFLFVPWYALFVSVTFLVVTRVSTPKTQIFQTMGEKEERVIGYLAGPFSYALSINILVIIFSIPGMTRFFFFPAASILVMMISDTAASFFGRRYGKHKYTLKYTRTTRSIEGSLALFVSAFILSLFAFTFFGFWFSGNQNTMTVEYIVLLSLLVAAISTILEAVSPTDIDDLIVPIAGCLVSFLLTLALFPVFLGL
jgi:dolichol kinase